MNQMVCPPELFAILSDYFKWVVGEYDVQIKMVDLSNTEGKEACWGLKIWPWFCYYREVHLLYNLSCERPTQCTCDDKLIGKKGARLYAFIRKVLGPHDLSVRFTSRPVCLSQRLKNMLVFSRWKKRYLSREVRERGSREKELSK